MTTTSLIMKRIWKKKQFLNMKLKQLNIKKIKSFLRKSYSKIFKKTHKRINQLKKKTIVSHFVTINLSFLNFQIMFLLNDKQFDFIIKIHTFKNSREISLMIDTKTSIHDFVKFNFVKYYKISTMILINSIQFKLIDNDTIHQFTHMIQIKIQLNEHFEKFWCFFASINRFEVILNMWWLKNHDVHIKCENDSLFFEFEYCLNNCLINNRFSIAYKCEMKSIIIDSFEILDTKIDIAEISIITFMKMIFSDKN